MVVKVVHMAAVGEVIEEVLEELMVEEAEIIIKME